MQNGNHDLDDQIQEAERRRGAALQEFKKADADLVQLRRRQTSTTATSDEQQRLEHMAAEQRRAAGLSAEQRRAEMRRRATELAKHGLAIAITGIVALAAWFIGQAKEHPMRPAAIVGVAIVAVVISLLPRPQEDDLVLPPVPPRVIRTPTSVPTPGPTATTTPTPTPALDELDESEPDMQADAEGAGSNGPGGMPIEDDGDDPSPEPTSEPMSTPRPTPEMPEPSPTSTGTPSPSPTPTPTLTPTPTPTRTPEDKPFVCVEVTPVDVEVCVDSPLLEDLLGGGQSSVAGSSSVATPGSLASSRARSSAMISLHTSMHSSQMYTRGPAMSFFTFF